MGPSFHKERRMWAYVMDTLLVAPAGMIFTHLEWLSNLCGYQNATYYIDTFMRGYVINNHIRAYCTSLVNGKQFQFHHRVKRDDLKVVVPMLMNLFKIDNPQIGLGAVPGTDDVQWPAKCYVSLKQLGLINNHEIENQS